MNARRRPERGYRNARAAEKRERQPVAWLAACFGQPPSKQWGQVSNAGPYREQLASLRGWGDKG